MSRPCLLVIDGLHGVGEVRAAQLAQRHAAVPRGVAGVEDAVGDRLQVPVLELR
jgi:hypothetical protein